MKQCYAYRPILIQYFPFIYLPQCLTHCFHKRPRLAQRCFSSNPRAETVPCSEHHLYCWLAGNVEWAGRVTSTWPRISFCSGHEVSAHCSESLSSLLPTWPKAEVETSLPMLIPHPYTRVRNLFHGRDQVLTIKSMVLFVELYAGMTMT